MELKKWKKNAEIEKFFETLMDEPFRNLIKNRFYNLEPLTRSGALKPSLDMIDKKDRLIVKAELPGINIDDVKISILDGVLNIKGETKEEKNIEKDEYYYSEITKGTYERSVRLPHKVKESKIKATYTDGILEVELPKAEESKPKEIKVKVENENK